MAVLESMRKHFDARFAVLGALFALELAAAHWYLRTHAAGPAGTFAYVGRVWLAPAGVILAGFALAGIMLYMVWVVWINPVFARAPSRRQWVVFGTVILMANAVCVALNVAVVPKLSSATDTALTKAAMWVMALGVDVDILAFVGMIAAAGLALFEHGRRTQ
jgi:hypothetical protein